MGRAARAVEVPGASEGAGAAVSEAPVSSGAAAPTLEAVTPDSGFKPANAPDVVPAAAMGGIEIPAEQRTPPPEPKGEAQSVTLSRLEESKAIASAVATAVADAMGRIEIKPVALPGQAEKVYPYHKAILAYAAKLETAEKVFDFQVGGCKTDKGYLVEFSQRELENAKRAEPEFYAQLKASGKLA